MNWRVIYSARAKQDLRDILDYLEWVLMAPETARKLAVKIIGEIEELNFMPERFPVYPNEPWCSQGIRYFPVKNYLIFYELNTMSKTVNVLRIMYGGRNIYKQLEEWF